MLIANKKFELKDNKTSIWRIELGTSHTRSKNPTIRPNKGPSTLAN